MKALTKVLTLIMAIGCASTRYYDSEPILTKIGPSYTKTQELTDQTEKDFASKTRVYHDVESNVPAAKRHDLMQIYGEMESMVLKQRTLRKQIDADHVVIQKALRNRNKITSSDPEWDSFELSLKAYDANVTELSKTAAHYSVSSNAFGTYLTDNKLYFESDVSTVLARVRDGASSGKKQLKVYDADIKAAEYLASQNGRPADATAKSSLQAERDLYAKHARRQFELADQLARTAGQRTRLINTDPQWSLFQKLLAEAEINAKEMNDIGSRLPGEIETFTNGSSR